MKTVQLPAIEIKCKDLLHDENVVVTTDSRGEPLSYTYSNEWTFSSERKIKLGGDYRINFRNIDIAYRAGIQRTLQEIYFHDKNIGVSTLNSYFYSLQTIARHLESVKWILLDDFEAKNKFFRKLKKSKLSRITISRIGTVINLLNKVGKVALFISRIDKFGEKYCCPTKVNPTQFDAIPEKMASKLYKEAIKMIEKYHPIRHEISDANAKYFSNINDGIEVESPKLFYGMDVHEFSLLKKDPSEIRHLQACCLLVLVGFSGARISEAISFNKSSYTEKVVGEEVIPVISGMISKTKFAAIPVDADWITHPIAKKALELAYDMGEFARSYYKEKYSNMPYMLSQLDSAFLVLRITHQSKNVIKENFGKMFREFQVSKNIVASEEDVEEYNLLNPDNIGKLKARGYLPNLSSHNFRRSFAVFLVRNKLGSVMALKYQYKHINKAMSEWYTNNAELSKKLDLKVDVELQDMIHEANVSVMTDILSEVYNSETLSGKEGERILKERNGYHGSVYMSREQIERQVRSGSASVVEHPTGYCFNPSCDRICSSDSSSEVCEHEVITFEKAKSRIPIRERLIEKFWALKELPHYENIVTKIAIEIASIEKKLSEHGIPCSHFSFKKSKVAEYKGAKV